LRTQKTIEPADLLFTDEDPGSLQKLVSDRPDATFLVPSSSISRRLGLLNVSISDFGQNWGVPIVAMIDSEDAAARSFVGQLRTFLAEEDLDQLFEPRLTLRQVNYFGLLRQARSVTGAAKLATVAQPAVTEQLGKLEAAVGGRLFVRSRNGLELTKEGCRFAQASSLMTFALDDLKLTEMGAPINARMGLNTWAAFVGTNENAAVAGDVAMLASEVQPVLKALRKNGIDVVAIHHHMTSTQPTIYFLHYWGTGPAEKLATGFKAALSETGKPKAPAATKQ